MAGRPGKRFACGTKSATTGIGLVQRTLTLLFVVVAVVAVVVVAVDGVVVNLQACLRHSTCRHGVEVAEQS